MYSLLIGNSLHQKKLIYCLLFLEKELGNVMKALYNVLFCISIAVISPFCAAGETISVRLLLTNASEYKINDFTVLRPGKANAHLDALLSACMTWMNVSGAQPIPGARWVNVLPYSSLNETSEQTIELDPDEYICFYVSHEGATEEETFSAIYKVSEIITYDYALPLLLINYNGLEHDKTSYTPGLPNANESRFSFPASNPPTYTLDVSFKGNKNITFYQPFMGNECYAYPYEHSPSTFGGDAGPYIEGSSDEFYTISLFPRKNREDVSDEALSFCYRVEAGLYHQTYGPYKIQPIAEGNKNVGRVEIIDTKHTCFVTTDNQSLCDPFTPAVNR